MTKRIAVPAATLALATATLVGATAAPSSAKTEHCDDYKSPDKVELDYETTTLYFEPGTTVCYKSSTQVFTTVVGYDGVLCSEAHNKKGKRQAISYYIVIGTPSTGS